MNDVHPTSQPFNPTQRPLLVVVVVLLLLLPMLHILLLQFIGRRRGILHLHTAAARKLQCRDRKWKTSKLSLGKLSFSLSISLSPNFVLFWFWQILESRRYLMCVATTRPALLTPMHLIPKPLFSFVFPSTSSSLFSLFRIFFFSPLFL